MERWITLKTSDQAIWALVPHCTICEVGTDIYFSSRDNRRVLQGCSSSAKTQQAAPAPKVTQRNCHVLPISLAGFHEHHFWKSLPLLRQPGTHTHDCSSPGQPLPVSSFAPAPLQGIWPRALPRWTARANGSRGLKPRLLDHLTKSLCLTSP